MLQTVSLMLLYLAALLSHPGVRAALFSSARNARFLRRAAGPVAAAAVAGAVAAWHAAQPGPACVLVAAVGLMAAGTLVTVLAPLVPRVLHALALVCLAALPLLGLAQVLR